MSSVAQITEARLAANRQNAQNSTGPRSESGKTRTRLNGLRHGLTGQTVLMPHEDGEAYTRFCDRLIAGFEPANDAERALARSIADGSWRLERARVIEENIFALGLETSGAQNETDAALNQAMTWLDQNREINLLSVYAGRISRGVEKAKRELAELQTLRRNAEAAAREEAILLVQLAESKGETAETEPSQTEISGEHRQPGMLLVNADECRTYPGEHRQPGIIVVNADGCRTYPAEHRQPGMLVVNGFAFSTAEIVRIIRHRERLAEAVAYAKRLRKTA